MDVHVYFHDTETAAALLRVEQLLQRILHEEAKMAATLDQVLQDVTDESTVIDSLGTLVTGLKQQVADALSGAALPPAVQAKVDAVFAAAESNKAKLAAAVVAGTPAAPAVP